MINYNLNFHQTFPPNPEFVMRLLEICDFGKNLTKEEISELTGIPTGKSSGKVEPHISYATYMGLMTHAKKHGAYKLELTMLGKELLQQDPGLQEKVSTAVCHARLSSKHDGASLWAAMYKSILPKYPAGINEVILKDELIKLFEATVKTGPFFSSYTGMFNNLSLLLKEKNSIAMSKNTIDVELIYVYAYALFYEWEKEYPLQSEITSNQIDYLKIADIFAFDNKTFYNVLEMLSEKNIIVFNRQLTPFTIIKQYTSNEIIPLLFKELC